MEKNAMIHFQNQVTILHDDIKRLQNVIDLFEESISYKFTSVPSDEEAKSLNKKISHLEELFQNDYKNIRQKLDNLRKEAEDARLSSPNIKNPLTYETKLAHWKSLLNSLKNACDRFQEIQSKYENLELGYVIIKKQNEYPSLKHDDLKHKIRSGDNEFDEMHTDNTFATSKYKSAQDKNNRVKQISQNINNLCIVIEELHKMIEESGTTIDRIEVQMQSSVAQTTQANQNLQSALRYQLMATKWKRILYLIAFVIFIIFFIYIIIKVSDNFRRKD